MQLRYSKQAGTTLVEIIMVVALIALITIGVLVYFESANRSAKVSEIVTDLAALSASIENNYAVQGDYTGISTAVVMGFVNTPERLKTADKTGLRHPWDNTAAGITIDPATMSLANDGYTISLNNVPYDICQDISGKIYSKFYQVIIDSIQVTSIASSITACGTTGKKTIKATK